MTPSCSLIQWPWERESPWGPLSADCGLLTCCLSNQTNSEFTGLSQWQEYRLSSYLYNAWLGWFPTLHISLFSTNKINVSFNVSFLIHLPVIFLINQLINKIKCQQIVKNTHPLFPEWFKCLVLSNLCPKDRYKDITIVNICKSHCIAQCEFC